MVSEGKTGQGFPKERRITSRENFLTVSRCGTGRHTRHFLVLHLLKKNDPTQVGITVSRKVGGAVQRNRVKRLLREFLRRNFYHLPERCYISIIAKKGSADLDYRKVCKELRFLINGRTDAGSSC
jgi:ribonuclease P protein component